MWICYFSKKKMGKRGVNRALSMASRVKGTENTEKLLAHAVQPNLTNWCVVCLISCNTHDICPEAHTKRAECLSWFHFHYYIEIVTLPRIHIDIWGDYKVHFGAGIWNWPSLQPHLLNLCPINSSWWWYCTVEAAISIKSEEHSDNLDFIAPNPPPLPPFGAIFLVTVYDKWYNKGGISAILVR